MKRQLEICVDALDSVFIAEKAGADRVELCSALGLDGLTPSYGMMKIAAQVSIPVYAMIRPRGGNFIFNHNEVEWMLKDIHAAHKAQMTGVVLGCLTEASVFDMDVMKSLYKAAKSKNMGVTVHRAFDVVSEPFEALDFLMTLGAERLLTSGQKPTALEGADLLRQLVKYASGRISIMVGSGINPQNLAEAIQKTNAPEYHFSARKKVKSSDLPLQITNSFEEGGATIADRDLILAARRILDGDLSRHN